MNKPTALDDLKECRATDHYENYCRICRKIPGHITHAHSKAMEAQERTRKAYQGGDCGGAFTITSEDPHYAFGTSGSSLTPSEIDKLRDTKIKTMEYYTNRTIKDAPKEGSIPRSEIEKAVKEVKAQRGGTKDDTGKKEFDRLAWDAMSAINDVHKFGDNKYEPGNWRKGLHFKRLINAAIRHLTAVLSQELFDKESKLLHTAHAATCCEMLTHFLLNHEKYKEFDDIMLTKDES